MLWFIQDEKTQQSCVTLSRKMTVPFRSGIIELQNLVGSSTTLPPSLGHGGPMLWAVDLTKPPGRSVGPEIHELCIELSLCQKNILQSLHERLPCESYNVFHQMWFTSRSLWKMFNGNMGCHPGQRLWWELIVACPKLWANTVILSTHHLLISAHWGWNP